MAAQTNNTIPVKYTKKYTSPQEIVTLLEERGLQFTEQMPAEKAADYLEHIGYFRLKAYLYPFLEKPERNEIFQKGTTFDMALNIYKFDRKLRILLFNELEKIEVAVRAAIVNIVSAELNDLFWMTNRDYFSFNSKEWNRCINYISLRENYRKEKFIEHFQRIYQEKHAPAWMIAEILPFGQLYQIFNKLCSLRIKKKVAKKFGINNVDVFTSWLSLLTDTRNLCCHHSRIWNRVDKAIYYRDLWTNNPNWRDPNMQNYDPNIRMLYFKLCVIKYFLNIVVPTNSMTSKIKYLLDKYHIDNLKAMGFPDQWQQEPVWQVDTHGPAGTE